MSENRTLKIIKRDVTYNVKGVYNCSWFNTAINKGRWEEDTFNILDYYSKLNPNKTTYLDVGSWIGPTAFYAARKYKKVICFEPDPVALDRFEKNLTVNDFKNITLIKKALSDSSGITEFGGNGELGNSESTLLVTNRTFLESVNKPGQRGSQESRTRNIVKVETITIEKALDTHNINPNEIALIKIDVEGGEIILVPYLETFLRENNINLYISLHRCFLLNDQIEEVLDVLFSIYDNCYEFSTEPNKRTKLTKKVIQDRKLLSLVFEK